MECSADREYGYSRKEWRWRMEDIYGTKRKLTVSLGEGYLSSFELGRLSPGDVVRTTKLAGAPATLLYDGEPMAECEVVVSGVRGGHGDVLGVRVCGMEWPRRGPPEPGIRDDLVEPLPTVLSLGSISVSLEELRGVAGGSIINLGAPFSLAQHAELLVTGVPVAAGELVVVGDEFGLRVSKAFGPRRNDAAIRSTGFVLAGAEAAAQIKGYDFRKPPVLSRTGLGRFSQVHRSFAQNLKAKFPALAGGMQGEATLEGVEQCTYGEAREEMARSGDLPRMVAENILGRHSAVPASPRKLFVEEQGTAHPFSDCTRDLIEKNPGGPGFVDRSLVLVYGPAEDQGADWDQGLLACLRGAWRSIVDMDIRAVPHDDPLSHGERGIFENEVVAMVRLARNGQPFLYLVYPRFTLEPFMGILD
jgi:flagellar motor switch/type III secretory pathway protein FliN